MNTVRRVAKGMLNRKWAEMDHGPHVIRAASVLMFVWKKNWSMGLMWSGLLGCPYSCGKRITQNFRFLDFYLFCLALIFFFKNRKDSVDTLCNLDIIHVTCLYKQLTKQHQHENHTLKLNILFSHKMYQNCNMFPSFLEYFQGNFYFK